LLETRMGEVKALDPKTIPYNDEKVRSAERKIRTSILEVFGEHSPEYRSHQVHEIRRGGSRIAIGWRGSQQVYEAEQQQAFLAGIPQTVTMLESLIETVKERTDASRRVPEAWIVEMGRPISSDKVFIVHGRKEGPREAVARFVEKLGLQPVILHEQASEGRTIIEKIEHHSDVG